MHSKIVTHRALGALGVCLVLSACGGGGGSETANPISPTSATSTPQLSRAQLLTVAADIYADVRRSESIALAALSTYEGLSAYLSPASQSWICAGAGSFSVAASDVNVAAALDTGDMISMDFNQCRIDTSTQGPTLDGQQAFSVASTSGTPVAMGVWSTRTTMTWTKLRSSSGGDLMAPELDGAMTFDMTSNGVAVDVTASATSLTQADVLTSSIAGLPSGQALTSLEYAAFTATSSVNADRRQISIQGQMVYRQPSNPTAAPVTATYTTLAPFTATFSRTPISGSVQMKASSSRGVSVNGQVIPGVTFPGLTTFRWTVLDGASVRLDTDENSDGVNESSHVFTFVELAQ
jgi:hypothetical protein